MLDVNGREYDATLDGAKGSSRLPDYDRLDVSLARKFGLFSWRGLFELQIVNLFNHKTVYIRTYDTSKNPAVFDDVTMLPLLPTASVKVEF